MKFNRNVQHNGVMYKMGDECPKDIEKAMKDAGYVGGETAEKAAKPKAGKAADAGTTGGAAESGMRVASLDQTQTGGETEENDTLV